MIMKELDRTEKMKIIYVYSIIRISNNRQGLSVKL
jgi:hypothetical protein